MAGRAVRRPVAVQALSLDGVREPTAQRAFDQVGTAVSDLQTRERTLTEAVASLSEGRFLGRQRFTASGLYVPSPGARLVRVRMVGGGGGGGGAVGGADAAIGAGGASGFSLELLVEADAITGGAVTIGAAGAAGSTLGGDGGDGGNTSVVVNGATFTAPGGDGGTGGSVSTTAAITPGGSDTAIAPVGVDAVHQGPGEPGVLIAGTGMSGAGGNSLFGSGGFSISGTPTAGNTGSGFGGGGSGGLANAVGMAGGAGAPGLVIVEEWT